MHPHSGREFDATCDLAWVSHWQRHCCLQLDKSERRGKGRWQRRSVNLAQLPTSLMHYQAKTSQIHTPAQRPSLTS